GCRCSPSSGCRRRSRIALDPPVGEARTMGTMTSLHKDIEIHAPAAAVWEALRDVGRPHERITPGVLTNSTYDGEVRTVTFANGSVVRERIVDIDEQRRRVAYAVIDGPFEYHHASMEVFEAGPDTSRIVWITDL